MFAATQVKAEDYMVSICGEASLRELNTPGKSGAVFYLTEDGKYMIKTVSRKESKVHSGADGYSIVAAMLRVRSSGSPGG